MLKSLDGDLVYAIKPRPTSFGVALIHRLIGRRPIIFDVDDWELSFCRRSAKPLASSSSRHNAPLAAVVDGVRRIRGQLVIGLLERLVTRADTVTVNSRFLQRRYGGTTCRAARTPSSSIPRDSIRKRAARATDSHPAA